MYKTQYVRAALSAWSCSNSRSIAPNSSQSRDLAGSGRDVAVTPEVGEGQLPPDPPLAAPFFDSFFFLDDIRFSQLTDAHARAVNFNACALPLTRP